MFELVCEIRQDLAEGEAGQGILGKGGSIENGPK